MHTYLTPEKLNRFNKNIPDICNKCDEAKGTLFHWIWECKEIRKFWEELQNMMGEIILKRIPLDPKMFLLGLYEEKRTLRKSEQTLMDFSLLNSFGRIQTDQNLIYG